uniref:Uncharacterized protein n=1 Tax=Amphimedon queenslandica TaxID=400682 RepID=A0A1X7SYN5_AMPQE
MAAVKCNDSVSPKVSPSKKSRDEVVRNSYDSDDVVTSYTKAAVAKDDVVPVIKSSNSDSDDDLSPVMSSTMKELP